MGLAEPRQPLDQHVAAGEHGGDQIGDERFLSDDHPIEQRAQAPEADDVRRRKRCPRHFRSSTALSARSYPCLYIGSLARGQPRGVGGRRRCRCGWSGIRPHLCRPRHREVLVERRRLIHVGSPFRRPTWRARFSSFHRHRTPQDPRSTSVGAIVGAIASVATRARAGCRCCSRRAARRRRGCPQVFFRRSPVRRAPRLRMGPPGIRWPHCSCRVPLQALAADVGRTRRIRGAQGARQLADKFRGHRRLGFRHRAVGAARTCWTRRVPVAWKERGSAAPGRASQMPRIPALKGAGGTGAAGSRRSSSRRRLWGTLAVAQCSSHGNACPCATMCEPWPISSNVENADAPPR